MPIGLRRTMGVVGLAVAITVGAMAAGPQTAAVRAIGSSAASGMASRTAMPPRSPAAASNRPVAPPLGDLAATPTGGIGDWPPARSTDPAPGATVGPDRAGADRQVGSHWRLIVHDDFAIDARPGAFLSTYRDFGAYPWGWRDTSKRGHYDPDILSVSGGILTMHMHTTADGIHHVAAPYAKLPGGGSNQLYGRYSVRFRADPVDG
jgi:hypothetical protein